MIELLKENMRNQEQLKFIEYLKTGKYVNNSKYFKFMFFNLREMKEELEGLLKDLFIDPIFLYTKEDLIVIYHNDDCICEEEYLDIVLSFSLDIGEKIKVFEGMQINTCNVGALEAIYNAYKFYKEKDYTVSSVKDMILYLVYNNKEILVYLKNYLLGKISSDNQLIKLIISMFECDLNVTKTASYMYMHRNTINNKLEYIEKETGFNVQKFKDAMALYILIKMI